MATLTIRNVDPGVKARLRVRAARRADRWKPKRGRS
jgi:plasmid stability protein